MDAFRIGRLLVERVNLSDGLIALFYRISVFELTTVQSLLARMLLLIRPC